MEIFYQQKWIGRGLVVIGVLKELLTASILMIVQCPLWYDHFSPGKSPVLWRTLNTVTNKKGGGSHWFWLDLQHTKRTQQRADLDTMLSQWGDINVSSPILAAQKLEQCVYTLYILWWTHRHFIVSEWGMASLFYPAIFIEWECPKGAIFRREL